MPMAGLAIGLVNASTSIAPQYAATVSALVLGAITLFETLGPPVVAWAFYHCGEAGKDAPNEQSVVKRTATTTVRWQGMPVDTAVWPLPETPTEQQAIQQARPTDG